MCLRAASGRHAECGQNRLQQLAGLELGVQHLCGRHLVAVDAFEQRPDQRGLSRADLTGDDDEALALVDAELEVRQRVAMPPAVEVERRVRVELEWRAAEAELRFVHTSAAPLRRR